MRMFSADGVEIYYEVTGEGAKSREVSWIHKI